MTSDELKAKVDAMTAKVNKVRVEIQALKDAVANAGIIRGDIVDGINNLEGLLQAADDDNPD